jgi:hypothetical protein
MKLNGKIGKNIPGFLLSNTFMIFEFFLKIKRGNESESIKEKLRLKICFNIKDKL